MIVKKKKQQKNLFESVLVFNQGQLIARKGLLTKNCLTLLQGKAQVEITQKTAEKAVIYYPGHILNQIELRFSCGLLKNIKCAEKCKVLVCPQQFQNSEIHRKTSYGTQNSRLIEFLQKYCSSSPIAQEIAHYSSINIGQKSSRLKVENCIVYLFINGKIQIIEGQNPVKLIQSFEIFPIHCPQKQNLQLHFIKKCQYFKIKIATFKYFLQFQAFNQLIQSIKQFSILRPHQCIQSRNKPEKLNIFKTNDRKKRVYSSHAKKLDRKKIMSQICQANQFFRLSIKLRTKQRKNQKSFSAINRQQKQKIDQRNFCKIKRELNESLCSFHKRRCQFDKTRQHTFSQFKLTYSKIR